MPKSVYSVYWSEIAYKDLDGIIDYISNDSIDIAIKILHRIKEKAESLKNFPERGRVVPELKFHHIENYREIIVSPWRIIYRIENDSVYIIAVFDGRRNFEDILMERLLLFKP
ncbi:type II toxin-antitoxin system RelE/ParE family toxin [candidate division WOR-3 bacterium]|nr:type II toxin-antitoxin system RelE/ParE family toxin [candidate division WOR-3 bacterium]